MYTTSAFRRRCAANPFTIIELMVVITIMLVVAALLLPAISKSRQKARYARWQGFANGVKADPNLLVCYDFQERKGSTITNQAVGPENTPEFNPTHFDGTINSGIWAQGR